MARTEGSQRTGLVSCLFSSSAISLGFVPGFRGSAVTFITMVCVFGFICGRSSSSALLSFTLAGPIRAVWKPPEVFSTLAWSAPALSARSLSVRIAASVPAQEKPFGKSSLAIWQTASPPSFRAASRQHRSSVALSRPATDSMACLPTAAASCMDSPRSLTSLRPSSKEKTPAAVRAVYSPSDRPAHTWKRVAASSLSARSFSMPAMPAMNIAGWQNLVSSSFSSGPLRQSSRMSNPRMDLAFTSISCTAGMSFTVDIIFTYCEPCPGKSRPTGIGGSAFGPAGSAATFGLAAAPGSMKSSSSSPSGRGPVPYFIGSKPSDSAAPGRLEKNPAAGFLPHSQQLYAFALFWVPKGMYQP
mmetsp:Transcript_106105/g.228577  ORF Transcript_106105/g.228577 Transcript_106105/m.228577 type:complete len:358 (+) Transcript_106105:71-1144(+)